MQEVFMNATFILEHIKRASYNLIRFLCWDETLNEVWELCICSSVHHNLRFRLRYRISPWKINYVIYRVGMIFVVYLVNFGPLLVTLPQSTSRLLESEFLDMFLQSWFIDFGCRNGPIIFIRFWLPDWNKTKLVSCQ